MSKHQNRIPKYSLHKPTGQARVIIDGRHIYLGPHGSDSSREEYGRLIAKHFGQGKVPAVAKPSASTDITVNAIILRFWEDRVQQRYQSDGQPSERQAHIKLALLPLRRLYGPTLAVEFGPRKLKAVREEIISTGYRERGGLNRNYVNDHVRIIKRMFRWAVSEELLPLERGTSICQALDTVENVHKGEDGRLRERKKIPAVAEEVVRQTLPQMSPQVATMVQLLQLSGMRPDEVTIMRQGDIEQREDIWLYRPATHKLDHKDIERVIPLGPQAQRLLEPWLERDNEAYLFSPREVMRDRSKSKKGRKTKARVRKPRARKLREHYDDETLCRAVKRACRRAGVAVWTPNQLRHSAATKIKRLFDRETARQLLGHGSTSTTDIYVDEEIAEAIEAMKRIG